MRNDPSTGERLETFVYNESTIEHLHRYGIARDYIKDKVVLDIACGEGYGANILATEARAVTGIDKDETVINNAVKKYKNPNLKFEKGEVENIPAAAHSFDVVVSFETLEHVSDHEKMLQEIKRVLKPGGMLIISTPDKKNYSDVPGYNNPFHKKELHEDQFTDLVRKFFRHSYFLHQKLMLVSAALLRQETTVKFYEGDYNKIVSKTGFDPMYIVAIASDTEMDKPFSSFFSGSMILQTALQQKEKEIHSTLSYRMGHFILSPLKWIRHILRK